MTYLLHLLIMAEIYDFDLSENRLRLEPSNISNNDNQPDKVDIKNVIFARWSR